VTLRAKRGWLYSIGVIGLIALLVVGAVLVSRDGGEGASDDSATGGFAVVPISLEDLAAASEMVVLATVAGQPTIEKAHFGTSSPMGAEQQSHEITLDIATYELRLDRCVVGKCPGLIQFKEAVNAENASLTQGLQALFFLEPSGTEWGAAGYASHFGREGVLVSREGKIEALALDGGSASRFLRGQSLNGVVAEVSRLSKTRR